MKDQHRQVMNDWRSHAEHVAEASCLHTDSIKPLFLGSSMMFLFQGRFRA